MMEIKYHAVQAWKEKHMTGKTLSLLKLGSFQRSETVFSLQACVCMKAHRRSRQGARGPL